MKCSVLKSHTQCPYLYNFIVYIFIYYLKVNKFFVENKLISTSKYAKYR